MKFLGWVLLLALNNSYAQEVIESTPLSVEDDGARKIIEGKNKTETLETPKEIIKIEAVEVKPESLESVEVETKKEVKKTSKTAIKKPKIESVAANPDKINPIDGQLKLENAEVASDVNIENKKIDEKKNVDILTKNETVAITYDENTLKKYLQFSYGFINSKYEKIHPSLDSGSNITSLAFVADMSQKLQLGLSMELLTDTSGQAIPDSIRSVQYRLFANYHSSFSGSGKFHWVSGLGLVLGDYGVRRRYIALSGDEASVKLHDGTLVGLIPSAGVRIYLVGKNSFDIMAEYHQYFGKPQSYIGGLAIAPRISFEF